jgi:hypothetical protein
MKECGTLSHVLFYKLRFLGVHAGHVNRTNYVEQISSDKLVVAQLNRSSGYFFFNFVGWDETESTWYVGH